MTKHPLQISSKSGSQKIDQTPPLLVCKHYPSLSQLSQKDMKQTPPPSSVNTIVRRFNTTTLRILLVTFFALKVFPMAIFDREGVDGGGGGGWKNLFLSTSKNLKYEQLYKGQCHCHNDDNQLRKHQIGITQAKPFYLPLSRLQRGLIAMFKMLTTRIV